ncbi:unnamed protein product [Brassicogethes aeneus]|uniref:Cytochrome P450 n=1 Tax=Brassicogethes aeneus TaxID=1431903 RepID=A0A9P0BJA2_BRAAE|nr:unnamed protein product [Brassicogethes aeneus]
MIWILVFILVAIFFYFYVYKPHQYWKNAGVQASGFPLPIVGNSLPQIIGSLSMAEFIEKIYKTQENVRYLGLYMGNLPVLILKDTELIKQILIKDFDHFSDHRPFIPSESDPLWGNNLFALTGPKWRDMRTVMTPAFTSSKMKQIFLLINETTENFAQHFEDKNEDLISLNLKETFSRLATDIIATTAFGLKVDSLKDPNNDFYLMGKEVTTFTAWQIIKSFAFMIIPKIYKEFLLFRIISIRIFSEEISNFFRGLIKETIEFRESKNIKRPDIIHVLMEARKNNKEDTMVDTERQVFKNVTIDDITSQAVSFFFAGFDSVSGCMSFTAYELAVQQDCQNKLRDEIMKTLKECDGKLTYEALAEMKYMDMVVSESLRKWPNAVATDRNCTKPYTIEPKYPNETPVHLKVDQPVLIPIFALQRDPKYFPDPVKFDPERFNSENRANIPPFAYMPFGVGPRACIGARFALMEVKCTMFHLLRSFKIVPVEKSEIPLNIARRSAGLTAENGFWFGLQKL